MISWGSTQGPKLTCQNSAAVSWQLAEAAVRWTKFSWRGSIGIRVWLRVHPMRSYWGILLSEWFLLEIASVFMRLSWCGSSLESKWQKWSTWRTALSRAWTWPARVNREKKYCGLVGPSERAEIQLQHLQKHWKSAWAAAARSWGRAARAPCWSLPLKSWRNICIQEGGQHHTANCGSGREGRIIYTIFPDEALECNFSSHAFIVIIVTVINGGLHDYTHRPCIHTVAYTHNWRRKRKT